MSLLGFCEWLASTSGSIALHESQYMYSFVESAHVLTLGLFVGTATMLDLRLLGVTMRRVPVSEVTSRLLPWTVAGFVVMVVTGTLLFYAIPVRTYQNIFFRLKLVMLVLAGANVWVFNRRFQRTVREWGVDPIAPRGARLAAAASLILWAGIIVAGRMIAYNWFDCGIRQQSAFINWAAGCVTGQ
jgi:hypothetical protein